MFCNSKVSGWLTVSPQGTYVANGKDNLLRIPLKRLLPSKICCHSLSEIISLCPRNVTRVSLLS